MRACRRRSGSPSIAVHSTSNRKRDLAADVPDAVDLVELVVGAADAAEVGVPLALVEARRRGRRARGAPVCSRRRARRASRAGARRRRGRRASSVCSWLRRSRSSVGHEPVGRAGQAPVAVQAGPDERLVGQVVADEQRGDPLEERGLGERAGGRQQAEDGPFDAVGQRRRGRLAVRPVGEPPAAGLDLDEAASASGRPARRGSGRAAVRPGRGGVAGRGPPRRDRVPAPAPAAPAGGVRDAAGRPAAVPPAAGAGRTPAGSSATGRARRGVGRPGDASAGPDSAVAVPASAASSGAASPARRRSWPARSRPTRISPSSRS